LFLSGLNLTKAKEKLVEELPDEKYAVEILRFINSSDRGLIKR
jgi:acyl-[acyl carrier protein]--UDP-N-acetylglucosamine O-acyltransferase